MICGHTANRVSEGRSFTSGHCKNGTLTGVVFTKLCSGEKTAIIWTLQVISIQFMYSTE